MEVETVSLTLPHYLARRKKRRGKTGVLLSYGALRNKTSAMLDKGGIRKVSLLVWSRVRSATRAC